MENKLMNALFGLAFWEQIFAPVPGAFHNPYQSVPTDMYDPAFSARRRGPGTRLPQLRKASSPVTGASLSRYARFSAAGLTGVVR